MIRVQVSICATAIHARAKGVPSVLFKDLGGAGCSIPRLARNKAIILLIVGSRSVSPAPSQTFDIKYDILIFYIEELRF